MIRKIHLDFHTHSDVPNVGKGFDPELFADTLAQAHVNWLATPGKCDMGNTYFDSVVGHAHPNLVYPDMFPATVEACVKRGIQVQAYYCLAWDSYIATIHPDWRQLTRDGKHIPWGEGLLCFASPYFDEVVVPGVLEMIERCPGIAGFWFDICLYTSSSYYSPWFNRLAQEKLGDQADDEASRCRLANSIIHECCEKVNMAVATRLPEALNFFNALIDPGNPDNNNLHPITEIENPMLFGSPEKATVEMRWHQGYKHRVIGLPSRFQAQWNDPGTLRTQDQMRFDIGRIVALGADVSMGDHRHPDGSLDPETYRRIGKIYAELETCERWLDGAVPCREAVLLTEIEWGSETRAAFPDETFHAARILEEGGIQFDIRSVNDPLPDYKLVIWPGQKCGSPDLISALVKHVQNGGALLAMNAAIYGLEDIAGVVPVSEQSDSSSAPRSVEALNAGQIQSPASGFFRLTPGCELYEDWHDFAHIIVQEVPSISAAYGTDVLANHIEALIGQLPCSANYPSDTNLGPAIVQRGKVIYSTIPLFTETRMTGTPLPALLIQSLCRKLLDRPLVKHSGGTTVAAHLHKMDEGYTLHLVHWALDRWGKQTNSALEFPILGPIDVELSIKDEVKSIALQPQGDTIPYCQKDDVCRFTVPQMKIWQIVVIKT